LGKRTQYLQTICIIVLIVGTLSSFGSSYKMSVGNSDRFSVKAEYENTISEPSGKNLELLGQYDENLGMPYAMYNEGDFLYVTGPSLGLVKMDISDATRPNILGIHRNESEFYGYEFCVQDDIAYFADIYDLRVEDITDINNVVELARISDFDSICTNVKAYGNLLIVNDYGGFIRFYNITDPANLVLINSLNLTHLDFSPVDYDYFDDTLYIVGNQEDNSSLVIYDITDISSPVYVGNYTTPYESRGTKVKVDGSIAYIMTFCDFEIVNISTPTAPSLIFNQTLVQNNYYYLRDMIHVDDTIYILNATTLITFDVSNSSEISLVDIDDVHPILQDFVLKDDYLYITNYYYNELIIYDTITKTNPQENSVFYFGGYSNDVCVNNEIAYVANQENGTHILDVSDPTNPQLIGSYGDGDSIDFVEVSGTILYAASLGVCLKLIDVSNPNNPILLSEYRSEDRRANYYGLEVSKDKVFLGQGFAGLEIIDVTDSSNPTLLGAYTDHYIYDIELMDNFVLADASGGVEDLVILNTRDPTNIHMVSYLEFEDEYVSEIAVEGSRAYLTCFDFSLGDSIKVVNIANPNNPKIIGSTRIDFGNILNIEVSGDYLYLASLHDGLVVLKNTFDRISYVGQSTDPDISGISIAIEKGYVYMASGWEGLTIFKAFSSMKITIIIISSAFTAVLIISVIIFLILRKKR